MTSDYDKPGPSSAGNFVPNNENESETRKYNYDDCIVRYRTDDDLESSDDENHYNDLHNIDGNVLLSEYRKTLNDDDEDDKRMNKILEYIYSEKEIFSGSEDSYAENEAQYKSFAEFISLLSGLEPSCSEKDGESINQETASKKETKEAAQNSTHKQKKNELDSMNNDDTHRSTKEIASSDAKNLMKSPVLTRRKCNEKHAAITENLPVVLLKRLNEPLVKKKVVKRKMKSKTIKSRHEAKSNYSSSDDENTNVPLKNKKRLRCKTKAPKTKIFKDTEYDSSNESDDQIKDKKQTTKSKLDKQEKKSIPLDDCANKNDSQVSDNSAELFSNIRNMLEQSLVNQKQLMDQSNKASYDAILNIINEYDNERKNKSSTLEGTDETKQVLLEQSNKNTVSAANSKKDIKGEDAADLLSHEEPISMSPRRSLRLSKNPLSANEPTISTKISAIFKASKSQNKPRRKLKFNVSDEETVDIKSEIVKNRIKSKENPILQKKKTEKQGNISKSKDEETSNENAGINEVGSSKKLKHLNLPKGETTSELQTKHGNDNLISKANQSQVSGFNETSDHVNSSDKIILSPIFKSRRSPRSKNQSVIVNNNQNMLTSTPNQNSCEQPKTIVITKVLSKKDNTSKSDLVRKANELPKRKYIKVSFNEYDDEAKTNEAIANVDPPIQTNAKVSRKLKELQNKKKLSTVDSEEENASNEIGDKQKISTAEGQEFIGIKGKASTSKSKKLTKVIDSKDKNCVNESEDDEDNENITNTTKTVREPLIRYRSKIKNSIVDTTSEEVSGSENEDNKSNGKEMKINVNLTDSKPKRNKTSDSPFIRRKAITSTSKVKKSSNMKMLKQDVESEEMKINPIVNDDKTKARTRSMKKSVISTSSEEDSSDEAEEVNVKENKRNVNATGKMKKGPKTTEVRNIPISSARKVKENQIMKKAIVSSDSEEQNICKGNEVEEIENKANATSAIKEGAKNIDQQVITNTSNASPRRVKYLQNMMKTVVSSFFEQDIFKKNEVEDINVKKIGTNANATGAIKKETKNKKDQQLIRNNLKASERKVKEKQIIKKTIDSEEQNTCNENEVEDINVKEIETNANVAGAIKKETKNKKVQQVIRNISKPSAIKVKELKNMKKTSEEQDICNENGVEDIKETETNANATGAIKKEIKNKNNKQVIRNNSEASTSKAKKKAIVVIALEEKDSYSEIEDNEVKNKEKLNVGSISQKRSKAAENKEVKNKKVNVSTTKVKKSPKKNISVTAKEQNSCSEMHHDEVKENTIVASTSQKVVKTVENQQVVRKNTTASKRKLKETPIKKHVGTETSQEVTSHNSKKKLKLNEVPNKNTINSSDDEMDEVSPQKRGSKSTQNSSKFERDFSLHNAETSSIKNESGSVYDKKLQRLCDELNASRKSFDLSFGDASLNDSVRRSGRSRKPPKLIGCMYIQTVESSTSGKKSMSRKSMTVSQTTSNASVTKGTSDQENDDIKEENLQVHDQVASQSKAKKSIMITKNTSALKSSTKKKIQSDEESDGTEKGDLNINEASQLKPNKSVGNKNLRNKSKISVPEKRKTSDEDNNESTAESQISGVQSTSSTTTARKKRKLFSPDTYLNSSAIVKCCEYKNG